VEGRPDGSPMLRVSDGLYRMTEIDFSILQADITAVDADVIALKYAQDFHTTDGIVADALVNAGIAVHDDMRPGVGEHRLIETRGVLAARYALFVGVPKPSAFSYDTVHELSRRTFEILQRETPDARHVITTVHGMGFGLDESEALTIQLAVYLEAIRRDAVPPNLNAITIIERSSGRVLRLRKRVDSLLRNERYALPLPNADVWGYRIEADTLEKLSPRQTGSMSPVASIDTPPTRAEKAAREAERKQHVFVAMPFKRDLDDLYNYGIQAPIHEAGLHCHRIDKDVFTGDILEQIKRQIETAALVIAVLTGLNQNVFLELGFAWGRGIPTLLITDDLTRLPFDVRGQRTLVYERIKDVEDLLRRELNLMRDKGMIQ